MCPQAHRQVEFFVAVQVAVRKIAGLLYCPAPVQAAHVKAINKTGLHMAQTALHAAHIFKAGSVGFHHLAAYPRDVWMGLRKIQSLRQKARQHFHIAVKDVHTLASAMLVVRLWICTAATIRFSSFSALMMMLTRHDFIGKSRACVIAFPGG